MKSRIMLAGYTAVTFGVFAALILISSRPLKYASFGGGLDASWTAASAEAQRAGWVFGQDFVFTSGPLSYLYTNFFSFELEILITSIKLGLVVFFAVFLTASTRLADRDWPATAAVLVFVGIWFWISQWFPKDTALLLLPWAAAVLLLRGHESRFHLGLGLIGVVIVGAYANAKFTVFVLSLPSFLLVDGYRLIKRRLPFAVGAFFVAFLTFYSISGQPLDGALTYLLVSFDVARGYAWAMGVDGHGPIIGFWFLLCLTFLALKAAPLVAAFPKAPIDHRHVEFLLVSGLLFVVMKQGFVRADLHVLQSFYTLFVLAGIELLRGANWPSAGRARVAFLAIAIGCAAAVPMALVGERRTLDRFTGSAVLQSLQSQSTRLAALLVDPATWHRNRWSDHDAQVAALNRQLDLPAIDGSVDSIDHRQDRLIAMGYDYRPRPTVQEYTTYTETLIRLNEAFFAGDRAPDYLILRPGSIDGRHPASVEGPLWPRLLQRYQPDGAFADGVRLRRRDAPLDDLLERVGEDQTALGDWLDLPPHSDPLFISIRVEPTLVGRLLAFAFRPPQLDLEITYADPEAIGTYRFVPGIAAAGIVLSPKVATARDFMLLASGQSDGDLSRQATRLRVAAGPIGKLAFGARVLVTIDRLDSAALRRSPR